MKSEPFGKYTLLSRLGCGGMSEVFLAKTQSIGGFEKLLAIKRLLPFCTRDQATLDLLADEARITVRLTHPNIVQVFDFGRVGDDYFIAMEYVDGLDLKSLVRIDDERSAPLPLDLALHITISILDALHFAHTQTDERHRPLAIIHRDVSPHNVLISRHGEIKLADFGVARAAISCHVSYVGDIRGKFSYMPPEQVCGGDIDHRVDLFAAGAILYELLSGHQPYRAASAGEQLSLLRFDMEAPSSLGRDLPRELDEICLRALDRDPDRRFPTAAEFAAALRRVLVHTLGRLVPPTVALCGLVERRLAEDSASAEMDGFMSLGEYSVSEASLIGQEVSAAQEMMRRSSAQPGEATRSARRASSPAPRPGAPLELDSRELELERGPLDALPTEVMLIAPQSGLTGELDETLISFSPPHDVSREKTPSEPEVHDTLVAEGPHVFERWGGPGMTEPPSASQASGESTLVEPPSVAARSIEQPSIRSRELATGTHESPELRGTQPTRAPLHPALLIGIVVMVLFMISVVVGVLVAVY